MNTKIFGVTGRFSLFVLLLLGSFAARAATIDQAAFCVDGGSFHFDVQVTGGAANEELILRIAADSDPFVRPVERIALNFDATTGEFTRNPPLEPEVQTLDAAGEDPEFDRWVDGPIADYELVDLGDLSWRFVGSVPHGTESFSAGDTIWGVALRSFTSPDAFLQDLPVTACEPEDIAIDVPFSTSEPTIDGVLAFGEWTDAVQLDIEHGFLKFVHDQDRLYVLIDVLDDTGDDPFRLGGSDQFWLHFDIDEDGDITPNVDLRYRLESGTGNLRYQTYCDDCLFGFNPPEAATLSARGEGFGCFVEDLSLGLLPPGFCNEHRVWEVALDLAEIAMSDDKSGRFGYLVGSGSPLLSESFPANLNDLGAYAQLNLQGRTAPTTTVDPGPMDPDFEVTQSVQTLDNGVDLAAGKPTAVRTWDDDNESTVKVLVHGAQNGIDLAGSPLFDRTQISEGPGNDSRGTMTNAFVELPLEWVEGGIVDFDVRVYGLDGSQVAHLQDSVLFAPTEVPVFWTVPIRNTLPNSTTLPTDNQMDNSERMLRRMVPLDEIDIVRRPIFDVTNITTSAGLKSELKEYDQATILAWTIGLLLSGEPPFDLPEQITGFNQTGLGSVGGSSDTRWSGGDARITWANMNPTTYVHELNHNLDNVDLSNNGTWGKHAPGCGSQNGGPLDPSWPYTNSSIQEPGVIWFGTRFFTISADRPELMTYCFDNQTMGPRQWISPYRWSAWLDRFRTDIGVKSERPKHFEEKVAAVTDSFYIMGRVFPDGSGEIGRVLRQPGLPSVGDDGGLFQVRVLDCDDGMLSGAYFTPSFVGEEGEDFDHVTYDFVLPAPPDACSLELNREGAVLDTRVISANPPVVELLSPNGGETWTGLETITWEASDADGDGLSHTILVSENGGTAWMPVASGITGNQYVVDSTTLTGTENAIIRILTTDGANTTEDDSDGPFTIAFKTPKVTIGSPVNNGVYDSNQALNLEGIARNTFGEVLPASSLIWDVDGSTVGVGDSLSVHLDEGDHLVVLAATGDNGLIGTASVSITMADLNGTEDPVDTDLPSVDLAEAESFVAGDRLVCEMTVRSGEHGLESGSRFACHVDFDDLELEAESGCDADGDGFLDDTYRLGGNGMCSTSDMALTYRHERGGRGAGKAGGSCTGGPNVICETREFDGNGLSDDECDGDVGGEPAVSCLVRVSGLLSTVAGERDAQCADPEDGCLGGVDPVTGDYRAYNHFEAHFREFKDWVPDTDDGGTPNSTDEVVLIPLVR